MCADASAQVADTVPAFYKQRITYTTGLTTELRDTMRGAPIDTSLFGVHWFDPVDRTGFLFRNTGSLGSAHFPMVCCPVSEWGLRFGYDQLRLYRFTKDNINFYQNAHPYTRLNMLIGQKKEQVFEVEHSQNIKKNFNFGFYYKRFSTVGGYLRQQTRHNDLAFTTRYDSKKRYLLKTALIFNSNRVDENGGVKNTQILKKDTSFISKQLVEIELQNAENRRRDIYFHAYQSWALGKFREVAPTADTLDVMDSLMNNHVTDSLVMNGDSVKAKKPEPIKKNVTSWILYHEADVGRERYEFNDLQPDSAYYGLFHITDSVSRDYISKAQNVLFGSRVGVKKFFKQHHVMNVSAYYAFHFLEQDGFAKRQMQNMDASASFVRDAPGKLAYGASAKYSFLDYNKGDFQADAFVSLNFPEAGKFMADAAFSRLQPAWLFNRFSFGNLSWSNDFSKQSDFSTGVSYYLADYNFQISARFQQIDGLVYWDENRLPAQSSGSQQAWVFEVRKLFRIKYFGFNNVLRVQIVSDKNLMRYPIYWGVHSLFYERGVFKGKLLTKIGTDIRFNANYTTYGYFPLTGQFHLQNEEAQRFFPVMDVYLSFKIQTVRLFFIMTHVNQGMFGDKGYFMAYKFPADDRRFRFGLSWMFLD